jgi:hypothetical protein
MSELYSDNRIMPDLAPCRFDGQEDLADSRNRYVIIRDRRALAPSAPSGAPT